MTSPRFRRLCSLPIWALAVGGLLLTAGCDSILVPKHKVLIDAIAAPGVGKPAGKSYRLVAKRSMVTQGAVPVVKACVDAALSGIGMFEPPGNSAPDIFIEVGFGRESAPRADAASRETYLQLSGRLNPDRSTERATGEEIWDVKVSVLGVAGALESAMPLLAAVASNNLGNDTRLETKIEVPQNSPMVEAVRVAAVKILEGKGAVAAPATAAPTGGSATR